MKFSFPIRTEALLPGARFARYVTGALLVGIAGGAFAIAFRLLLHEGLKFVVGSADVLVGFESLDAWQRLLYPACGGLLAGLVMTAAARQAMGHGVAEVMEAVALGRGEIRLSGVVWKSVASLFAIVGGGSIGREGSIIQFGAGAGSVIARALGLTPRELRALVAAGTAAGFAAAYNTPIAAVIFVAEIVTGVLNLEIGLGVMAATAVSTLLTRMVVGGGPLYGARVFTLSSHWELIAYGVLGLLAGIAGPLFMTLLSSGDRLVKRLPKARWLRGALGGLGVGALALGVPAATGNGYEAIQRILDSKVGWDALGVWLIAKAFATTSSVSSGSPGGVFTPTLFLGAALGGLFGHDMRLLFDHGIGSSGAYALIGMAALTAATTHAPLMAATLVFELSGDYSIVLPLLLATSLSAAIASRIKEDSIYTEELARRGIPWRGNLTERLARNVHAEDIMSRDVPRIAPHTPCREVLERFARANLRTVYVLCEDGVRRIDVRLALRLKGEDLEGKKAFEVAEPVEAVGPQASLLELSQMLWSADWGEVPVVAGSDRRTLLGVVTRRDLLGALDREVIQREVLLTRVVRFEAQGEAADYLELPPAQRVETIAVPPWMVGQPIDYLLLRERYGVIVIGVRTGRGTGMVTVPPIVHRPTSSERLIVIGPLDGIERLEKGEGQSAA